MLTLILRITKKALWFMGHQKGFRFLKHILPFILILSFINYSCYSYYEISQNDLQNKKPTDIVIIEMKNKNEIKVMTKDININMQDSLVALVQGSEKKLLKLSEIKNFSEPKIDIFKTVLSMVGIAAFIVVTFYLFYALFSGPRINITGG